MPDYDSTAAREFAQHLEEVGNTFLPLDYGSSLLQRSSTRFPRHLEISDRVLNCVPSTKSGGIVIRSNNSGFIVNIRPSRWKDNLFFVTLKNLQTARCTADAIFYYTGHPAFHFKTINNQFPPLHVANQEPLRSREMCKRYVSRIAKGKEFIKLRKVYKKLVTELVQKFAWDFEGVLSWRWLADTVSAKPPCATAAENAIVDNEFANTEDESYSAKVSEENSGEDHNDSGGDESALVEIDCLSEGALSMFTASAACSDWDNLALLSMNSFCSPVYVPGFDISIDGSVSRVESAKQRLGDIFYHARKKEGSSDEKTRRWTEMTEKLNNCDTRDFQKILFEDYPSWAIPDVRLWNSS